MTVAFTRMWYWWLVVILASFVVMEAGAILYAHACGEQNIQEWTLSDTIRRWRSKYRWLAPLVVGTCAFLLMHFFGMGNR